MDLEMDMNDTMNGTMCMLSTMNMPGMEVDTSQCTNVVADFTRPLSLSLPTDVLPLQQL